jgi:succinoglycan biosynthesis transport protein ExoP
VSKNFELLRDLQIGIPSEAAPAYAAPGVGDVTAGPQATPAKVRSVEDKRTAGHWAAAALNESPLAQEEARKLVQNIFLSSDDTPHQVVVFAGVDSGNGCSRISSLMSRTLAAHTTAPICLVDANLRTPAPASAFHYDNDYGLTDSLRSPGPISEFVRCAGPENLSVLSCGSGARDSVALLTSSNMRERMADLRNEFAYVLIDAPPLNNYADAVALGQLADGLVLILEANVTRRESALRVADHLRNMQVKLLGAVLNKRTFPIPEVIYNLF